MRSIRGLGQARKRLPEDRRLGPMLTGSQGQMGSTKLTPFPEGGRSEELPFKMASFTPHELTRVVLRAIRENRADIPLWKAVISRTSSLVSSMQGGDLSVIVYGLGRMKFRDRALLDSVAAQVIPQLHAMSLNDISHLLSGFARVEVRNDLLFDLASREIGRKLNACKSLAEISNLTQAYTSLNYHHTLLFEALGKRAMFLLPFSDSGTEIPKLVEAIAKTEIDNQKLFALLSSEICKRIDTIAIPSIARIANSYSKRRLLRSNQFLSELILDESFRRRHEFDPVATALLLNAVGRIKSPKTSLMFDYFVGDLGKRGIAKFDIQSVALLAHAVGKHCGGAVGSAPTKEVQKLFQLIGDRVAVLSENLSTRQVAMLANAFACVGARHGPLLYNLPRHVEAGIDGMNLSDLAAVMHGYAKLGIRNDVILACTPVRIEALIDADQGSSQSSMSEGGDGEIFALSVNNGTDRRGGNQTGALVRILESFAMLMVNEKKLLPKLVLQIERNKDTLSDTDVLVTIPKSLNMLSLECPEGLAGMIAARVGNATLEDAQRQEIDMMIIANNSSLLPRY